MFPSEKFPEKGRTYIVWAICHWRCGIYPDTIRRTRAEAIAAFQDQYDTDEKCRKGDANSAIKITATFTEKGSRP